MPTKRSISAKAADVFLPGMEIEIAGQNGIVVLPSREVFGKRPGDDWVYVCFDGEYEWVKQVTLKHC